MGCCVDEAGGVTPKRPRRFELLASFSLQSFAGRTHAKTPEGRHSGRAPFSVHSSFTPPASGPDVSVALQHPNQTCPTAPARGLGQRQPKQQKPWIAPGVIIFGALGARRVRPTTAYDGQLSQPYRLGRSSSRST